MKLFYLTLRNVIFSILFLASTYSEAQIFPSINSLGFPHAKVNSIDTIFGSNFNPINPSFNSVFINKMPVNVISASSTQLLVRLPIGATYGKFSVTSLGIGSSSNLNFNPTFENGGSVNANSFDSRLNYKISNSSINTFDIADYDNNGTMEFATVLNQSLNVFGTAYSKQNAYSFSSLYSASIGINAQNIESVDLDGNGKLDIVCSASNSTSLSIKVSPNLSSNNQINFGTPLTLTNGSLPGITHFCIRDLNNDGKPDIIATFNPLPLTDVIKIVVFLNTSSMNSISFSSAVVTNLNGYTAPATGIYSDDVDNDGLADILLTYSPNGLLIIKNNSTSSNIVFGTPAIFPIGSGIAIGDLDGDGRNDISYLAGTLLSVLKNSGINNSISTSSYTKIDFSFSNAGSNLLISDVNGDAKPDIVIENSANGQLTLFQNNSNPGNLSFLSPDSKTQIAVSVKNPRVSDLNLDGKPDLISCGTTLGIVSISENISGILKANSPIPRIVKPGNQLDLSYSSTLNFGSTNAFEVQLSNSQGEFISPTILGYYTQTTSQGNFNLTIPFSTVLSPNYKIRIISSSPALISEPVNLTIAEQVLINSISQNTGMVGNDIIIYGNYFNEEPNKNTIFFGPTKANKIVSATSSMIKVRVPENAGYGPITVTSNGFTAQSSESFLPIYVGSPTITSTLFSGSSNTFLNPSNINFDLGDLNNDGFPDLIVANAATSGTNNTVLINSGIKSNINIQNSTVFTSTSIVNFSGIADLDGDGVKDLAYVAGTNILGIYRNNGIANILNVPVSLTTLANASTMLAFADINKDGKIDIITAGGTSVSIFINNNSPGNILASSFTRTDIISQPAMTALLLEDLDGDFYSDIILTNSASGNIRILKNTSTSSTISFATGVNFTTSTNPRFVTCTDINKDGKPDLAVVCGTSNMLNLFENSTINSTINSSSFSARVDISLTSGTPNCIAVGDIDGDGNVDLAVTNSGSNNISILRNIHTSGAISTSSFAAKINITTFAFPSFIKINDMNGDEKPDIIVLSSSTTNNYPITFLKNNGGLFTMDIVPSTICSGRNTIFKYTATNTYTAGNTFTLQLSDQNGSFANPINIVSKSGNFSDTISAFISSNYVGSGYRFRMSSSNPNLNSNDNKSEIEISNCPELTSITPSSSLPDSTVRLRGSSFSSDLTKNIVYFGANKAQVVGASDTTIDVIVPRGSSIKPVTVTVNKKQTNGTHYFFTKYVGGGIPFDSVKSFAAPVNYPLKPGGKTEVVDLNADGKTDIIFYIGNEISLFINTQTQNGMFNQSSFNLSKTIIKSGGSINSLNVHDINNDGLFDIICWSSFPSGISIYLNSGDSNLFNEPIFINSTYTIQGAVGDFDKDGKPDLLGINSTNFCVFKNNSRNGLISSDNFSEIYIIPAVQSVYELNIADFNRDGFLDILTKTNNGISFFRNLKRQIGIDMFSSQGSVSFTNFGKILQTYVMNPNDNGIAFVWSRNESNGNLGVSTSNCNNLSNIDNLCFNYKYGTTIPNAITQEPTLYDIDGTGTPQIISISSNNNQLKIFVGQDFSASTAINEGNYFGIGTGEITGKINIADFDNDGRADILYPNTGANGFSIIRNEIPTLFVEPDTSFIYYTGTRYNQRFYAPGGTHFKADNQMILELSNKDGNFDNPIEIGRMLNAGNTSAYENQNNINLQFSIPGFVPDGDTYKLRIRTTNSAMISKASELKMKIRRAPFISHISPTYAAPGALVYVYGNNFSLISDSILVNFGLRNALLIQRNDTCLVVEVPHGASHAPIQIITSNLQLTSPQFFSPGFSGQDSLFNFVTNPLTATSGQPITLLDLNNDNKTDLVEAYNSTNSLIRLFPNTLQINSVFAQTNFTNSQLFTSASTFSKIFQLDINNDGKREIIGSNNAAKTISIYWNTSSSSNNSFALPVVITTDSTPTSICFADMNRDGKTDIIVGASGKTYLQVFFNTSNSLGAISFNPVSQNISIGSTLLTHLRVEDLDGDLRPEIIAALGVISNQFTAQIRVLKNLNNQNNFSFSNILVMGLNNTNPSAIEIADLNADGRPDILATCKSSTNLYIGLNIQGQNKTIGLVQSILTAPYNNISSLVAGELNGDGFNDLVMASENTSQKTISLLRNNANKINLNFIPASFTLPSGSFNGSKLFISDMNNDGLPDLTLETFTEARIFKNNNQIKKPTLAASQLILSKNTDSLLNVSISRGNGEKCLILAKQGSPVNAIPTDSISYIASDVFGNGSQIGVGNYVIYNGPLSKFTLQNISNVNSYHFKVFEYNGPDGNNKYMTSQTLEGSTLNNQISGNQVICKNNTPSSFSGSIPNGGNNQFVTTWVKSLNGPNGPYSLAEGKNDTLFYQANSNDSIIWYKRVVQSLQTIDSSNVVSISRIGIQIAFSINNSKQCISGNQFNFADSSESKLAYTRVWNFGNGNNDTSTISNPTKSYTLSGIYNVKLVVSDVLGCKDSLNQSIEIVGLPNPIIALNSATQCLNANQFIFSDSSTNSNGTRTWKLNNETDTSFNFSKTFNNSGIYSVKLISSNSLCTDSTSRSIQILESPKAGFILNTVSNCEKNNQFQVTDTSSNNAGRIWSFGEGISDSSSSVQFNKTYSSNGNYTIKLVVMNQSCKDSISKNIQVLVSPKPGFSFSSTNFCEKGNFFNFNDTSTGNTYRIWNFGESLSDTSSKINPGKSFTTSGIYTIKLVAGTNSCKDSITKSIQVFDSPKAQYNINKATQCLTGNSFIFSDSSIIKNGNLTNQWDFGNGTISSIKNPTISYSQAGIYQVKLVNISNNNCRDSIVKTIQVDAMPNAAFYTNNLNQCINGNRFVFSDVSNQSNSNISRIWTFDDLSNSTDSTIEKQYILPGNYSVKLLVKNSNLCTDSITKTIQVFPNPKAGFNVDKQEQCINGNIFLFTDTTTEANSNIQLWLFGDNTVSSMKVPFKIYSSAGTYSVKLITKNSFNCTDSASMNVVVHPNPITSAIIGEADVFRNETKVYAVNQTNGSSYQWFFEKGIGNKTGNSTSILWQFIGTDEIKLIETGIGNCKGDTVKLVVNIKTPVGINELNKNQFINIYPNPNSGSFYISDLNNITSIEVFDNQGKLVQTINEIKHQAEINLNENLKSGLYFLRINTLESVYYSKIEVIR